MRFDPDCVRDILICTESRTDGDSLIWNIPGPSEADAVDGLSAYPYNVAAYHFRLCQQRGLIEIGEQWITGGFEVVGLTDLGHQMLSGLRLPQVQQLWRKAKDTGLLSTIDSVAQWALGIVGMLLK